MLTRSDVRAGCMLPSKPYFFSALYQWIVDSGCTPHIVVDASLSDVQVPHRFVKNGQIVLNIAPGAVIGLLMDKKTVTFNARFGGVPFEVYVPMYAIMGIYAKENGQGMMFEAEPFNGPDPGQEGLDTSGIRKGPNKPSLRVVK